jgi:hypothetical protein
MLQLLVARVIVLALAPATLHASSRHDAAQLPDWFVQHRTHAHTRFAPEQYCRKGNATGQWACDARFENASAELASLGVPVFVRQTHSREEGAWWPTETTPKAGWAPLVHWSRTRAETCLLSSSPQQRRRAYA